MLDHIHRHIEDGTLSFIIGAGFSTNISTKFPLWGDLLKPLVGELYPACAGGKKELQEREVQRIIAEKGYLEIASEYVRRKGYHEAMDLYIEKRMPYLKSSGNGEYGLFLGDNLIDDKLYLGCHKKLLGLGVKHIFTFNYDNALDILAGVDVAEEWSQKQEKAVQEVNRYKFLLEQYKGLYCEFERKLEAGCTTELASVCRSIESLIADCGLALVPFKKDEWDDAGRLYQQNLKVIEQEIVRQESLVGFYKERRADTYQLITDSYQISLTEGGKNIYKLHGNLRTGSHVPYGFDGDRHMQYVITAEDYRDYPRKHEAFVNLMRISLLKGAFCLIGFSGDDPNFMAWIDWVKDILDKGALPSAGRARSIYFIHSGAAPLGEDKQLLLQNHYIEIVNLFEFFPDATSDQERVDAFLEYMSRDKERYERYEENWKSMPVKLDDILRADDDFVKKVEETYRLSAYNRIPEQQGISHYHRLHVLSHVDELLEGQMDLPLCAKLIYAAIRGESIPVDSVLSIKQTGLMARQGAELKEQYHLLALRARCMGGRLLYDLQNEDTTYETVLSNLFHLYFSKVKILMDGWNPESGLNKMRYHLLRSVLGSETDADAITRLISRENFKCLQDYRFAIDILPLIRGRVQVKNGNVSFYGDLQGKIEALERHNPRLIKVGTLIENLLNESRTYTSGQPYGNLRHTVCFDSYDVAKMNSLKVLHIFLELGVPSVSGNVHLMEKEKWQMICENLYEEYPYPCLFFSLLYGNSRDFLLKVAQDYIYSFKLYVQLPELLRLMLRALQDKECPANVCNAIYIVAPVFMKAVAAKEWEDLFEQVFVQLNLKDMEAGNMQFNEMQNLIVTGAARVNKEGLKHKILLSVLKLRKKINDFHNRILVAVSQNLELNKEECKELDHLVQVADTPAHFYVLMNMDKWVDRSKLIKKLSALPDEIYEDGTLLEAACRYVEDDPGLQAKLKHILLHSPLLWRTGIHSDCSISTYKGHALDVYAVQKYISFSDEEIVQIYEKLQKACKDIEAAMSKWRDTEMWEFMGNWTFILTRMQSFILQNQEVLQRERKDYNLTKRNVLGVVNKERGGNDLLSLFVDDKKTGKALVWLENEVIQDGVSSYKHEYLLLFSKVLMRDSLYLNSCLIHLRWALEGYREEFEKRLFKPLLGNILNIYEPYFDGKQEKKWDLPYAEKNIVEQELIKLYGLYRLWNGKSPFWEKYNPRY